MFVNITEKPPWGSVIKAITIITIITITANLLKYLAALQFLFHK